MSKVVKYKTLKEIVDNTNFKIHEALIPDMHITWYAKPQNADLSISVEFIHDGKKTSGGIANIFGDKYTTLDIGPIMLLLSRLLFNSEQRYESFNYNTWKDIPCRIVTTSKGWHSTIAIGHPVKDYFLLIDDMFGLKEGDILPDFTIDLP